MASGGRWAWRLLLLACLGPGAAALAPPPLGARGARLRRPLRLAALGVPGKDEAAEGPPAVELGSGPEDPEEEAWREEDFGPDRLRAELGFLCLAAAVGVGSGLGVCAFKTMVALVGASLYGPLIGVAKMPAELTLATLPTAEHGRVYAALVPAVGGVLVSAMRSAAGGFGGGLGDFAQQVERQRPFVASQQFLKVLAAVGTLGTGNSLGPEGPAVEIGASMARIAGRNSASVERQRKLLLCGCAAGVAAGFNAPLAGVFFSLEVAQEYLPIVGPQLRTGIAGVLLASVTSALTSSFVLKEGLALRPAPYELASVPAMLPLFLGLGLASGIVAVLFKALLNEAPRIWDVPAEPPTSPGGEALARLRSIPEPLRPAIFGLVCGVVGLFFPEILFFGYDTLDRIISSGGGPGSAGFLLLVLGMKAIFTAGSLAFGLVGGTFAPALFLGAVLGAAYEEVAYAFLKSAAAFLAPTADSAAMFSDALSGDATAAFALVGAASVLAALFRAPLTSLLLLFELTQDYEIMVIAAASAGVASLTSEISRQRAEYGVRRAEARVRPARPKQSFAPAEMGISVFEDPGEALVQVPVEGVMAKEPLLLSPNATLLTAIDAFRLTGAYYAIIVQPRPGLPTAAIGEARPTSAAGLGRFVGLLSVGDVARALEKSASARVGAAVRSRGFVEAVSSLKAEGAASRLTDATREYGVRDACTPRTRCLSVREGESAGRARELFQARGVSVVPVLSAMNPRAVVGLIDRQSLLLGQMLLTVDLRQEEGRDVDQRRDAVGLAQGRDPEEPEATLEDPEVAPEDPEVAPEDPKVAA